jgi:outer membrane protein OmpA-like peptidoglycan-associated protein/flagellar hook assembly protein FlgD
MKSKTVLIIMFFIGALSYAQQIEELYSPDFLAMGYSTVSEEAPMSNILNPAASGRLQRASLDLSYFILPGFGDKEEGLGHAINFGLTIPSRFAVFSQSGHFITSPFEGANLGKFGSFYFSMAKDLFPNFLVGLGVNFMFGKQEGDFNWALGADIGVIHIIEKLGSNRMGFLKDFKWGIAIRGLGNSYMGYKPDTKNRYFPHAFTPSIGLSFMFFKTEPVSLNIMTDISFPSCQSFHFYVGGEFAIKDFIFIRAAYHFDFEEYQDDSTTRMPFMVGMMIKFKTKGKKDIKFLKISEKGWDRSEFKMSFSSSPLQNETWGLGAGLNLVLGVIDRNPPEITEDIEDVVYVSPNLDGTSDDLILPIKIKDERYIMGYTLIIEDENGEVVKTIVNKDERPENLTFRDVMARFIYRKSAIPIPEYLRWDGKSDTGTVVEDGTYTYYIESWDDNGNMGKSEPQTVVIDTTPPSCEISSPYLIFSPNGDGSKDTLPLECESTDEDVWYAIVRDFTGYEMARYEWEGALPESFEWGGTDSEGLLLPDGVYSLTLSSTDRAGNFGEYSLDNIIINTQATPININIDLASISPDGDSVKDSLTFTLNIPVKTGIESWNLFIMDKEGTVYREFTGEGEIPENIVFDGMDADTAVLEEKQYTGELKVLYDNGNHPDASSPVFTIDLTPPEARVSSDLKIFSPNNDGNKDMIKIFQEAEEDLLWTGEIYNSQGEIIRSFSWKGRPAEMFDWLGRDEEGRLVEDGLYSYILKATDLAGNFGQSESITFELNTEETPVILTTDLTYFSPNRDNIKESVLLIPQLQVVTGIESYVCSILDKNGNKVKSFSGGSSIPDKFIWDGTDDSGKVLPDGEYTGLMDVLYLNGNNPIARSNLFYIDTVYPAAEISSDYILFSPNGDGRKDTIIINQETSTEELWEGEVIEGVNNVVRNFTWQGSALDAEWDGKDNNGNKLPDGFYTYRLTGEDRAGNKTQVFLKNIQTDTRPTPIFIIVYSRGFSPNGDNYLDTISFNANVLEKQGIISWSLDIVHSEKGLQKRFTGSETLEEVFVWDGFKDSTGGSKERAPEGEYSAVLTVEYKKGNMPVETTRPFVLDVSPPKVEIAIVPELFSPDNDGENDELYIRTQIEDLSPIAQWKMEITDPAGNHFTSFLGTGTPSGEIIWDGISDKGVLVESAEDYPLELNLVDDLGNKALYNDIIPVDVLVIREGDKLKIRIPSINFSPGTADYLSLSQEIVDKNLKTLDRLAEIFKKYKDYNIRIEGHALNVYWEDPERAAIEDKNVLIPLSKERAEVIKKALIDRGISEKRITTFGLGSSVPIVPFSDEYNRWKNRRVEFILIKKQ